MMSCHPLCSSSRSLPRNSNPSMKFNKRGWWNKEKRKGKTVVGRGILDDTFLLPCMAMSASQRHLFLLWRPLHNTQGFLLAQETVCSRFAEDVFLHREQHVKMSACQSFVWRCDLWTSPCHNMSSKQTGDANHPCALVCSTIKKGNWFWSVTQLFQSLEYFVNPMGFDPLLVALIFKSFRTYTIAVGYHRVWASHLMACLRQVIRQCLDQKRGWYTYMTPCAKVANAESQTWCVPVSTVCRAFGT